MTATPNDESASARRSIAELQQRLAAALAELQTRSTERDEALAQQAATSEVLQIINTCVLPAPPLATGVRPNSVADHPAAGATRASLTVAEPRVLANDGEVRLGAANPARLDRRQPPASTALCFSEGDIPLLKPIRGSMLAAKPPGTRRMPVNVLPEGVRV